MTRKNITTPSLKNFDIVDIQFYSSVSSGALNKFPLNLFSTELFEAKLLLAMKSTLPNEAFALDSVVLTQTLSFCSALKEKGNVEGPSISSDIRLRYPSERLISVTACDTCKEEARKTKLAVVCRHNSLIRVAGTNLTSLTLVRRHAVYAVETLRLIDRAAFAIKLGSSGASLQLALAIKDILSSARELYFSSADSKAKQFDELLANERRKVASKGGKARAARNEPLRNLIEEVNRKHIEQGRPFPSARQLAIHSVDIVLAEAKKNRIPLSEDSALDQVKKWAGKIWKASR